MYYVFSYIAQFYNGHQFLISIFYDVFKKILHASSYASSNMLFLIFLFLGVLHLLVFRCL